MVGNRPNAFRSLSQARDVVYDDGGVVAVKVGKLKSLIWALARSPDGFVLLGTGCGLYRFALPEPPVPAAAPP